MTVNGEMLRKVNDSIYQEATPPEDRTRPLEWRRAFNAVTFTLKNPVLTTRCHVTDFERSLEEEEVKHPGACLRSAVRIARSITATVDQEQQRDTLYYLSQSNNQDIFEVEACPKEMEVVLKEGEPIKGNENVPDGVFLGSIFRADYEPKRDYICLEAMIPPEQLERLIAALGASSNLKLTLTVYILSLSFEVDDALREWYHPRDLIISDSFSPAPINVLSFTSGGHTDVAPSLAGVSDSQDGIEDQDPANGLTTEPAGATTAPADLQHLTAAVLQVRTAVWFAIVAAIAIAIFK